MGGPPPVKTCGDRALSRGDGLDRKARTVLSARPSRRKERRLGPEGLRSLPREPVATITAEPHQRQRRSTSWRPETKRSSVDDPRMAVSQPASVPPWSSNGDIFTTRRSRPSASSTIGPPGGPDVVLVVAARPPLVQPGRTASGQLAPRGTPLPGGGLQPWPL